MRYICVVKLTGNCDPEPIWDKQPNKLHLPEADETNNFTAGGTCSADPKTCGRYSIVKIEESLLGKTSFRHTVISKEQPAKEKPVKATKKKPLQGSLF